MIDLKALRFDKDHHMGLGDVRLTIDQQDEIEEKFSKLRAVADAAHEYVYGEDAGDNCRLRELRRKLDDLGQCEPKTAPYHAAWGQVFIYLIGGQKA
jgi:hypothetical protein